MRRDPRVTLTIVDPRMPSATSSCGERRIRGGAGRRRHDRRPGQEVRRPGQVPLEPARRRARQSAARRRARTRDYERRTNCASGCGSPRSTAPTSRCATQAARRGRGRGHALHLGPLLPAVRRPRRRALRGWTLLAAMAEATERPVRRARHLQLLPQPEPARRHGAHRRPPLGRAAHPRHRVGLVRARLRRVRLRVRHRGRRLRRFRDALPASRRASASSTPRPCRPLPILIGGAGEKVTLRLVAE